MKQECKNNVLFLHCSSVVFLTFNCLLLRFYPRSLGFRSLFEVTTPINFIYLQVQGSPMFYNLNCAEMQEPTCIYRSI